MALSPELLGVGAMTRMEETLLARVNALPDKTRRWVLRHYRPKVGMRRDHDGQILVESFMEPKSLLAKFLEWRKRK